MFNLWVYRWSLKYPHPKDWWQFLPFDITIVSTKITDIHTIDNVWVIAPSSMTILATSSAMSGVTMSPIATTSFGIKATDLEFAAAGNSVLSITNIATTLTAACTSWSWD
eukprot:6787914-Ditylum_brightwellii.AAC.1